MPDISHKQLMDSIKSIANVTNADAHVLFKNLKLTAHPGRHVSFSKAKQVINSAIDELGENAIGHTSGKQHVRNAALKKLEQTTAPNTQISHGPDILSKAFSLFTGKKPTKSKTEIIADRRNKYSVSSEKKHEIMISGSANAQQTQKREQTKQQNNKEKNMLGMNIENREKNTRQPKGAVDMFGPDSASDVIPKTEKKIE